MGAGLIIPPGGGGSGTIRLQVENHIVTGMCLVAGSEHLKWRDTSQWILPIGALPYTQETRTQGSTTLERHTAWKLTVVSIRLEGATLRGYANYLATEDRTAAPLSSIELVCSATDTGAGVNRIVIGGSGGNPFTRSITLRSGSSGDEDYFEEVSVPDWVPSEDFNEESFLDEPQPCPLIGVVSGEFVLTPYMTAWEAMT